jgi:hypothetical protein
MTYREISEETQPQQSACGPDKNFWEQTCSKRNDFHSLVLNLKQVFGCQRVSCTHNETP